MARIAWAGQMARHWLGPAAFGWARYRVGKSGLGSSKGTACRSNARSPRTWCGGAWHVWDRRGVAVLGSAWRGIRNTRAVQGRTCAAHKRGPVWTGTVRHGRTSHGMALARCGVVGTGRVRLVKSGHGKYRAVRGQTRVVHESARLAGVRLGQVAHGKFRSGTARRGAARWVEAWQVAIWVRLGQAIRIHQRGAASSGSVRHGEGEALVRRASARPGLGTSGDACVKAASST